MYRNVTLLPRTLQGRPSWQLLAPDGKPIDAFHAFQKVLRIRNTRNAYCRHVAEMIDYLIEATAVVGQGRPLTKMELTEVLEAYWDYLRLGVKAPSETAQNVAKILQPSPNKPASLIPKKAAVRKFLNLSEAVRAELLEKAFIQGKKYALVDEQKLLPELGLKVPLAPLQANRMKENSMLAGVIAHGPQLRQAVPFDEDEQIKYDERRAFPYDKVSDLIEVMPTYRDKTIYSLLAASGCRTYENLQLLFEDLNVTERSVRLVSPKSRPSEISYVALSVEERDVLAWKGRATDLTFLIEPFASAFFEYLENYIRHEYISHGKHNFVFQQLKQNPGYPYFLVKPSSRLEIFSNACRRIGVKLPPHTGPHSLRHMYGTFALNYFPRANGTYGLPMTMVQQLMGHAQIKHTEKYARYDKDLLKAEIEAANRAIFGKGLPPNLLQLQIQALEVQISTLQANLRLTQ